jgi:hypothetical protein
MKNEIAKSTLKAGNRKYFFDVNKASSNNLYLEITESRKMQDGTFNRHNIMVFQEDIQHFKNVIVELYEKYFNENNIKT